MAVQVHKDNLNVHTIYLGEDLSDSYWTYLHPQTKENSSHNLQDLKNQNYLQYLANALKNPNSIIVFGDPINDLRKLNDPEFNIGISASQVKATITGLNDLMHGTKLKSFTVDQGSNIGQKLFGDMYATSERSRNGMWYLVQSLQDLQKDNAKWQNAVYEFSKKYGPRQRTAESDMQVTNHFNQTLADAIQYSNQKYNGYTKKTHSLKEYVATENNEMDRKINPAVQMRVAFSIIQRATNPQTLQKHIYMSNLNNQIPFGNYHFTYDEMVGFRSVDKLATQLETTRATMEHYRDCVEAKRGSVNDPNTCLEAIKILRDARILKSVSKVPDYLEGSENKDSILAQHLRAGERTGWAQQRLAALEADGKNPDNLVGDCFNYLKNLVETNKLTKDLNELSNISEKFRLNQNNYGKVPMNNHHAAALTGRSTGSTGGPYSFNSQGIDKQHQGLLTCPEGQKIISIDFSAMEVAVAISLLGNKQLLSDYNKGLDIYLAIGLRYHEVDQAQRKQQKLGQFDWNKHSEKVFDIQNTHRDYKGNKGLKPELNSPSFAELRDLGKSVVLPRLYGSGLANIKENLESKMGLSHDVSERTATLLCEAFDTVFPQLSEAKVSIDGLLKTYSGPPRYITLPLNANAENVSVVVQTKDNTHFAGVHKDNLFGELGDNARIIEDVCRIVDRQNNNGDIFNKLPDNTCLTVQFVQSKDKVVYDGIQVSKGRYSDSVSYTNPVTGQVKNLYGGLVLQNLCQAAAAEKFYEFTTTIANELKHEGAKAQYATAIHDDLIFIADENDVDKVIQTIEKTLKGEIRPEADVKPTGLLNDVQWKYEIVVSDKLDGTNFEIEKTQEVSNDLSVDVQNDQQLDLDMAFEEIFARELGLDNHNEAQNNLVKSEVANKPNTNTVSGSPSPGM